MGVNTLPQIRLAQSCAPGQAWNPSVQYWDDTNPPALVPPGLIEGHAIGVWSIGLLGNDTFAGIINYLQYFGAFLNVPLSEAFYLTTDVTAESIDSCAFSSLTIECGNPPPGRLLQPYGPHTLVVTGGTPPYGFAIIAGALPTGLSLDAVLGIISGIPTVAGTFTFTVQVTDADLNTAEVECSITIRCPTNAQGV